MTILGSETLCRAGHSIWADRVPPAVLKAWMGHSSITTTERYIHVTDDTFRRWVNASEKDAKK